MSEFLIGLSVIVGNRIMSSVFKKLKETYKVVYVFCCYEIKIGFGERFFYLSYIVIVKE